MNRVRSIEVCKRKKKTNLLHTNIVLECNENGNLEFYTLVCKNLKTKIMKHLLRPNPAGLACIL